MIAISDMLGSDVYEKSMVKLANQYSDEGNFAAWLSLLKRSNGNIFHRIVHGNCRLWRCADGVADQDDLQRPSRGSAGQGRICVWIFVFICAFTFYMCVVCIPFSALTYTFVCLMGWALLPPAPDLELLTADCWLVFVEWWLQTSGHWFVTAALLLAGRSWLLSGCLLPAGRLLPWLHAVCWLAIGLLLPARCWLLGVGVSCIYAWNSCNI